MFRCSISLARSRMMMFGIEVWIECVNDAVQIQQRLRDHREFGRQPKPAIGRDSRDLQCHFAGVHATENRVELSATRSVMRRSKDRAIKSFFRFAHFDRSFGGHLASPSLIASISRNRLSWKVRVMRPTMPRSSSAMRSSSVRKTFPGCGSAWKRPSMRNCLRYALNNFFGK